MHILQLRVDRINIPSPVGERFLRLLDVNVKLDESVRPRYGVYLPAVVVVEFLSNIFQIIEGDPLGEHLITEYQIADLILYQIAGK